MCPNCRAFITIRDRVCPYCGVQLGPRAIDFRPNQFVASFLPSANLTAIIIISINILFFLLELIINYRAFNSSPTNLDIRSAIVLGAKYAPFIRGGQWWRLITAGFLHGGLIHIAMNSWSLFILVTEVEQFYGTSRLIAAFFVSTFTGFLFSYYWAPGSPSLGASAACFGMFGIMLAMGVRQRADPLVQAVRAHYGQWLIFGIVLSLMPGIDMAAHVGGFVGGFLVGLLGGLPGLPNSQRETLWKMIAAVALLITVYAFVLDFFSARLLLRQLGN